MQILLTYPSDGLRLFQSMVPLGLLSIGTVVKEAGYSVRIVDFNHYHGNFRKDLLAWQPRIVGIGGTTPSRMKSFRIAREVKKAIPDAIVVYGGVNATFTASEVLKKVPEIDYIIMGEGDLSFKALCDRILRQTGEIQTDIPGLAYRAGDQVILNPVERINDLSLLPIPDRDLLDGDYRLDMDFVKGLAEPIITSRGCPAKCNFCSASQMFPGGVRYRPMDQVGREIEYLLGRKKFDGLKLFDSTFTSNKEKVLRFCETVKPFNLKWECEIRADTVDFELLRTMKEAGCYYVNMGLESSDTERLKKIAKGISTDQALKVLADCRELGILAKVFFTFGHPGQTYKECKQDVQFIREHRKSIDFYAVTPGLRVYPGTRLEKETRETGLIAPNFSWVTSRASLRNLILLEPSNTVILFQKGLGPWRLLQIVLILLFSGLYSSREFMLRMIKEIFRHSR
jgi:anaerobic magnesium-protoporphyrin IX monomethyl ester cyclase